MDDQELENVGTKHPSGKCVECGHPSHVEQCTAPVDVSFSTGTYQQPCRCEFNAESLVSQEQGQDTPLPEFALADLELWFRRVLDERLKYRSMTRSDSPTGGGYTYVEIPDWELRQKQDLVRVAINGVNAMLARAESKDKLREQYERGLKAALDEIKDYWERHPEYKTRASSHPVTEVEERVAEIYNRALLSQPSSVDTTKSSREREACNAANQLIIKQGEQIKSLEAQILAERKTSHDYTTRLLEEHERDRIKWRQQFELLDDPDGLYSNAKAEIANDVKAELIKRVRKVADDAQNKLGLVPGNTAF